MTKKERNLALMAIESFDCQPSYQNIYNYFKELRCENAALREQAKELCAVIDKVNNVGVDLRKQNAKLLAMLEKYKAAYWFVEHIQNHLNSDQVVICKICGKSIETIKNEGNKSLDAPKVRKDVKT